MAVLKIKRLRPNAKLPARATLGSAGYDLHACITEAVVLHPHQRVLIPTGFAIQLESENQVGLIYGRSSLGLKYGITPANAVGVIDSDYRGEVMIPLTNHSEQPYTIQPDQRIAQLVICPIILPELILTDDLDNTDRGNGGFGSSN